MWEQPDGYQFTEVLYLAGEVVPPGTYRQVGTKRKIELDRDDRLPGSLDGRVACYVRIENEWNQMQSQ